MNDTTIGQSGTSLLAIAMQVPISRGNRRCFYCLAACGEDYTAKKYVKKSFTSRDTVGGGGFVCSGCVAALVEKATLVLPDGTVRTQQKMRNYSWVITRDSAVAVTKSHRAWLLGKCLDPPEPPFVISISDSGQKQLLYRSRICHSRNPITITLEGDVIVTSPDALSERVNLCKQIVAVLGKPAILKPLAINQQMRLVDAIGERLLHDWISVQSHALTHLAAWFTPKKEDCQNELQHKSNTTT